MVVFKVKVLSFVCEVRFMNFSLMGHVSGVKSELFALSWVPEIFFLFFSLKVLYFYVLHVNLWYTDLIFVYDINLVDFFCFCFFAQRHPVAPATYTEKAIFPTLIYVLPKQALFSTLKCFCTFIKNQLSINV